MKAFTYLPLLLHLLFLPAVYLLTKRAKHEPLGKFLPWGWSIKVAAGWISVVVFKYYYHGSDLLHTFRQSMFLRAILLESPWRFWQFPYDMPQGDFYYLYGFPDLTPSFIFICKTGALISLLTGQNIWLMSLWFSTLSFAGFWLLGNQLCRQFSSIKLSVVISFFLVPSVAFWSAGIFKETLLWAYMSLMFWAGLQIVEKLSLQARPAFKEVALYATVLLLAGVGLFQVKYYVFAIAVVALLFYFLLKLKKSRWIALTIGVILLPFLFWVLGKLHFNLALDELAIAIHRNYTRMVAISDADNLIWLDLSPKLSSLIHQLPYAFKAAWFVPMPWQEGNWLKKLAGVENLTLLLLFLMVRFRWVELLKYLPEILAALVFTISLALLLALSAPNVGALARYKASYLPLAWLLICAGNPFLRTLSISKLKAIF
ncbi:MAG: hypothetical protein RMJ44_08435 [Cytophagales bacterium]|nr:hypothetical protein [Bernardetiaceae bacterium]MDW8211100.1 hypothetical protein [Cytophagales bacterium]